MTIGVTGGAVFDVGLGSYLVDQAWKGNYIPSIVTGVTLATTNLASLIYEFGRRSQSNIEYLESRRRVIKIEDLEGNFEVKES